MAGRDGPLSGAERMRRLRARRAAGLLPPEDGPPVRSADDLLLPAVAETLAALGLGGQDAAAARLARAYASAMDEARDPADAARRFGPLLRGALESLGATPMSRSRLRRPEPPRPPGALDALRQARASRHRL